MTRSRIFRTVLVIGAVVLSTFVLREAIAGFIATPLKADLDLAKTVVVGKITDIAKEKEEYEGKLVLGVATVEVSEVLKGQNAKEVKMTVVMRLDSELGNHMQSPSRVYHVGDEGIWVVMSDGRPSHGYGLLSKERLKEVKEAFDELDKRTWSQEVNGLKVWASADTTSVGGPRKAGVVMFAVKNVSTQPIYLPRSLYKDLVTGVLRDSAGKEFPLRGIGEPLGSSAPPLVSQPALQPGETRYLHPDGENYGFLVIPKDVPSGKYFVNVKLANAITEGQAMPNRSPVTLWKGSIAAPPISIEILEIAAPVVPSAPAVVEGLAMTVTPTKAIFNRGEELAFAIVLKNESAKAFALYDAAFAHDYVLRVGDWQVQYLIQEEREPGPPQILKPGETLSVALRIDADAAQYMWTGPQDKTVPPRKSLPPGKYSVTVSRTFAAAPARLNLAEPSWTGKITSNPVVIEVSPIPALKAKRTDLADLEKQLEDACGGRWEVSGEVLKGIFDLPPEGGAAQNAMFLVFPWNGDEKGAEKAKAFVKDWNRPMEVIWTQEWTVLGGPSGERPQGAITPFQAAVLSVIKRNFQERFDTCDDAVLYVADRAARDDLEFFRAHMTKRATDEWARRLAAMIRKANIVETYKKAGGSYLDLEGGLYFVLPLEDTGNGWIVREFPVLR